MIVNKQLVIFPRDRLRSFTAVKLHVYFFILSTIQYLLLLCSVYYVKRASFLLLTDLLCARHCSVYFAHIIHL